MRKSSHGKFHEKGFTLMEILIAIGICSVAAMALMALVPLAHQTEKSAIAEALSTQIASNMMEGLSYGKSGTNFHLATGTSNGVPVWSKLDIGKSTNYSVAYDSSCQPIRPLHPEETDAPLIERGIAAVATLCISSKKSVPHMVSAEVIVATPPSAPPAGRTVRRFVKQLAVSY